jgi:hypothetical protein
MNVCVLSATQHFKTIGQEDNAEPPGFVCACKAIENVSLLTLPLCIDHSSSQHILKLCTFWTQSFGVYPLAELAHALLLHLFHAL